MVIFFFSYQPVEVTNGLPLKYTESQDGISCENNFTRQAIFKGLKLK